MAGASARHIEPLLPAATGNVTINVDTPGRVTWAGATDITLIVPTTTAAFTLRRSTGGSTLRGADRLRFAAAGGSVSINVDTPGQMTWAGQAVALNTSILVGAGAITWAGQSLSLGSVVGLSPGAITWTGQTVELKTTIAPISGTVTWTGQSVVLKTIVGVTAGQITWQGQTVAFGGATIVTVTVPGAVTWTGQTVNLVLGIVPVPGALNWSGQSVAFTTKVGIAAGQITWAGQTVFAFAGILGEPVPDPRAIELAIAGAATQQVSEGKATLVVTEGQAT